MMKPLIENILILVSVQRASSFVAWPLDLKSRRGGTLLSVKNASDHGESDRFVEDKEVFERKGEVTATEQVKSMANDTPSNNNPLVNVVKQAAALLPIKQRKDQLHAFPSASHEPTGLDKLGELFQTLIGKAQKQIDEIHVVHEPAVSSSHESALDEILASLREETDQGRLEDTSSFAEIFSIVHEYGDMLASTWTKLIGRIGPDAIVTPAALWYYLECEDERKNPSWKRRVHRYYPKAGGENLDELNCVLGLAQLTYLDTADEVRRGLRNAGYELVYIDLVSEPGRPAHFLAVQTEPDVSLADDELAALIGIRGTKTVADTITDVLCETVDYRGGRAHGFLLRSAQYLVDKHMPLLVNLVSKADKSRIVLTLTGHSLGAGVASLASIEFNDKAHVCAYAYGFGTPPALSLDLAKEASSFVTTVVSDADVIPRLSSASVVNLILSISSFDWREYATRDVDRALAELHRRQPILFNDMLLATISNAMKNMLMLDIEAVSEEKTLDPRRSAIELYPPGRCVHFFRDGRGISASVVPNDFFQEIDVSRSMIPDHLFDTGYQWCMLELVRERLGDQHFRFEKGDYVE